MWGAADILHAPLTQQRVTDCFRSRREFCPDCPQLGVAVQRDGGGGDEGRGFNQWTQTRHYGGSPLGKGKKEQLTMAPVALQGSS